MDYVKGLVVKNKAGRDKNRFFVITGCFESYAEICDGKYRRLEKPKKKNIKHLAPTKTVLDESNFTTNKKLRNVLKEFNNE